MSFIFQQLILSLFLIPYSLYMTINVMRYTKTQAYSKPICDRMNNNSLYPVAVVLAVVAECGMIVEIGLILCN